MYRLPSAGPFRLSDTLTSPIVSAWPMVSVETTVPEEGMFADGPLITVAGAVAVVVVVVVVAVIVVVVLEVAGGVRLMDQPVSVPLPGPSFSIHSRHNPAALRPINVCSEPSGR